jgi:hypothetical protein
MAPAAGSAGLAVEQFWHSPEQPPAPLRIIANAPGAFAGHIVKGSIANARTAISVWSRGQLWCAALLVGGILLFVPYLWKLDRGLVCAGLTYIATTWLVLSIRWQTVETRYFNTICLMVVLAAFTGYAGLIDGLKTPFPRRWLNIAALSCGMIYGVVIIPYQSWLVVTKMTSVSEELVGYREFCQRVDQEYTRGSAVVVGSKPYLYSWYTSAPSLAIPAQVHTDPNAAALRRYMEKYHARFVLLTHEELKFWRPQWSQDGFPEDLEVLMQDSHGILFARKVAP